MIHTRRRSEEAYHFIDWVSHESLEPSPLCLSSRLCLYAAAFAAELLLIAVCAGPDESELGPVDTIGGLVLGKLYGAVRASAAVRAASLCHACATLALACGELRLHPHTQDLAHGRRAPLMELEMCSTHRTDGTRALGEQVVR